MFSMHFIKMGKFISFDIKKKTRSTRVRGTRRPGFEKF